MERGAHIGIHSWSDGVKEAKYLPEDAPEHVKYTDYTKKMLGSDDFYWFTVEKAPAEGIYEMSEEEILKYGLLTQPIQEPSTNGMPGVLAYKTASKGNKDSDIVIVYAQHGPLLTLLGWGFGVYFPDVDEDKVYLVSVAQAQTLAPYNFQDEPITMEDAKKADAKSVQIIADVVKYFKDNGKQVYVVSKGFGGYIVQEFLAKHGTVADGYLIVSSRLDMQDEAWQSFANGKAVKFEDGTKIVPDPDFASEEEGEYSAENMARLMGALAENRYTEALANTPLDNLVYIYGEKDDRMGRLSDAEVAFLNNKNATVMYSQEGYSDIVKKYMGEGLALLIGEENMK